MSLYLESVLICLFYILVMWGVLELVTMILKWLWRRF